MSKVLVTGGAGFIGSHITDILIDNGYSVVIVDDLSTGKKENINKNAVFYNVDITSGELSKVFEKEKPDFVIHEAAQINLRRSLEDPAFDARVNIIGSINILECCRKHGVKKIVYASSGGAVYGEPERLPCDEKHPTKPLCPYGASKLAAEIYLFIYEKLYNIDYVALRYSNVYGPRQDPKGEAGVISIFLDKIKKKEKPQIFGDGKQTRDYVFVGDVARANLLALEKNMNSEAEKEADNDKNKAADKPKNKAFNIGTGKETDVNEIFLLIKNATGTSIEAEHTDPVPGEIRRIKLDCGLAKKELGWGPEVELTEGIKRTVEWFEKSGK